MNRQFYVKCPYCGRNVSVLESNDYFQKTVETCDEEDGGCGRDFVVYADVKIVTVARRIEGVSGERSMG